MTKNPADVSAVAITKDDIIVGHVPKKISIFSIFLHRGGSVVCTVTDSRRYSADLLQGGLEIL